MNRNEMKNERPFCCRKSWQPFGHHHQQFNHHDGGRTRADDLFILMDVFITWLSIAEWPTGRIRLMKKGEKVWAKVLSAEEWVLEMPIKRLMVDGILRRPRLIRNTICDLTSWDSKCTLRQMDISAIIMCRRGSGPHAILIISADKGICFMTCL